MMIILVSAAVCAAILAALMMMVATRRAYDNKIADAFALGVDFGKAIQDMTAETMAAIVAEAVDQGIIPAQRKTGE